MKLIAVGKLKKGYVREGVRDYITRLKHYIPFEMIEIKEGSVLKFMNKEEFNVLLDMRGKTFTSEQFARFISERISRNSQNVNFFIGGATGFSDAERDSADMLLSLSEMTLPHEIARLVFVEQLYRAFTIIRNEKYHK